MHDSSPSGGRLFALLFAAGGAGAVVAVWFTLDALGVGLRRMAWPFSSPVWLALLAGAWGFIFGRVYHAQRLRRAAAQDDPVEDDDTATETDGAGGTQDSPLPAMPLFADCVAVARRRSTTVDGVTFDVFDLTTEGSDGDGGTMLVTRTIALLPAEGLPPFDLAPRMFSHRLLELAGATGLRFDADSLGTLDGRDVMARFAAAYRVTTASTEALIAGTADGDEQAVRRLFPLKTLRTLLGRSDWRLQSHGGRIACWVDSEPLGSRRRARLIQEAAALRSVLLAAQAGEAGAPPSAPPGESPVQRQAARLQASLLGGVLGAFAGFFIAVLSDVGELLGPKPMSATFPLAVFGGGLLGATAGSRLPLRRPLLRKPLDPRREKAVGCAVLAGLFGGFLLGGLAGVALGEQIGLKIGDHRPRQLLLFGGMGAGALLGSIALGVATNRLYLRIAGRRDSEPDAENASSS